MKKTLILIVASFGLALASIVGCSHTAQGVKDDTQNAVRKTGDGMKDVGDKMADAGTAD